MWTQVSWCHLLILGSLLLTGAQASPKERLKVKYKIKKSNNNGEHLEKQKVGLIPIVRIGNEMYSVAICFY